MMTDCKYHNAGIDFSFMLLAAPAAAMAQKRAGLPSSRSAAGCRFRRYLRQCGDHHPVEINYRIGLSASPNFKQPNETAPMPCFSTVTATVSPTARDPVCSARNSTATITCSSCHRSMALAVTRANARENTHLRVNIVGKLCGSTCIANSYFVGVRFERHGAWNAPYLCVIPAQAGIRQENTPRSGTHAMLSRFAGIL